jgi:hypothetical protein
MFSIFSIDVLNMISNVCLGNICIARNIE